MEISAFVSRLRDATKTASGWSARCPTHDDQRASLSIAAGDDGRVLVHCHAGCSPEFIIAALGLKMSDLMPAAGGGHANGQPKIVATYNYVDEQGTLLYQVVRFDPKDFRQRRPKPGGGWTWSVKGVRLVPYRLPELLAADTARPVVVVEGEKDADRLAGLGILATTNAGGAGKWRPEYAQHFHGRAVLIIPDSDKPGRQHANQVARSLHGIAKNIKIVELPGVAEKGDVSDWLDAGGTVEQLRAIVKAAPPWQPSAGDAPPPNAKAEIPPYVPFPTDTLPAVVRDFIRQGAKALGCDESYVALPTVAALAAAVGNTRRIRLTRTWSEPCIVWAVIVAVSGTLKTPGFDLAMHCLRCQQAAALKEYEEAMTRYATAKTLYDADLQEWKKKGRKNSEPPPEEPEEPVAVRYIVEDTTVEALAVLLQNQPRGLLLARDELSGWINSFDAYKSCRGADVAHWLSMHRAGPMTVDRKTGLRMIHVPRAAVCIAGTVQPKALATALVGRYRPAEATEAMDKPGREHFDNGLAARLLFAMPPKLPKSWTEADLPLETERQVEALFGRLLQLDFAVDESGDLQPVDIPLGPGGKAAWITFYNDHAREQVELHGDLSAAWSKLEGGAARFALLIHLIRAVSMDPTLTDPNGIDAESIKAGVALVRWFGEEASRVYAMIGGDAESPEARERRELVRIVRDHGGKITVRQLMRASRRYRASAEDAEKALGRLVVADIVDVWEDKHDCRGGRPVFVFTMKQSGDGDATSAIPERNGVLSPSPPDTEGKTQVVPELSPPSDEVCEWTG